VKVWTSLRPVNFVEELIALINRYSKESGSDTPDFILGEYMMRALDNWNMTTRQRDRWYRYSNRESSG